MTGLDDAEQPAVRAEQLFARLTDPGGTGAVAPPVAASDHDPAQAEAPPTSARPRQLTDKEVRDFFGQARVAVERLGQVARAAHAQANGTGDHLVELGEAVEQALGATNDRLAHLEHLILGGPAPAAAAAEQAANRLRAAVRWSNEPGAETGKSPAP